MYNHLALVTYRSVPRMLFFIYTFVFECIFHYVKTAGSGQIPPSSVNQARQTLESMGGWGH